MAMKTLHVNLGENSYDILVENGLLSQVGERLRGIYTGEKVFVLTDENVDRLYGEALQGSLEGAGYRVRRLALPPGEPTKCFDSLLKVYEALVDFRLTRGELVVTLGGGVVGDLGGFAAATYLRGVPFVQVPTSLLAQVDSSVGGKVAVDLAQGKNLVGSFYQPKAVFIDPQVLSTLTDDFFRDGMGEVVKTACIKDAAFFDLLASLPSREQWMGRMEEIVHICCAVKAGVVERDEHDTGERMLLNFGHTLGHAIEQYYHYTGIRHGEAVAAGMALITQKSEALGLTEPGTAARLIQLEKALGLPTDAQTGDGESILQAITLDKKNIGGSLKVVLLRRIGESYLYSTTAEFFR